MNINIFEFEPERCPCGSWPQPCSSLTEAEHEIMIATQGPVEATEQSDPAVWALLQPPR